MLEITISQNKKKKEIFMLEMCKQSLLCDQFMHQNTAFYETKCVVWVNV